MKTPIKLSRKPIQKQTRKHKNITIIAVTVLFFTIFSIFGTSPLMRNDAYSNIGTVFASAQEPADINNDNIVNIFDLSTLLSKWNSTDTTSDLNNDGVVNIFDLSTLLSKWGSVSGTLPEANVARVTIPAVTVTASTQDIAAGQGVDNIIDGSTLGYPVDDSAEWSTIGGHAGSWAQITWASPVTINRVVLYDRPNTDDQITGGNLTFSDGSTVTVPSLNNGGAATTVTFTSRTVTSVRLNITSVSGSTQNVGLAEMEAWGIVVGATNHAPVANASTDQTSYVNYLTTLNGNASADPDANALTYAWSQVSGTTVTLANATTAAPTFTPTATGTYVFSLTVSDGALSSSDTVTVTVEATPPAGTLTMADLQLINTKRVVFGHQSVGGNIMDGIDNTYSSMGVTLPSMTTTRTAPASGAYFMDFYVGSNGDPAGKISDFNTVMRNGTGSRADVAFFKFCYVDMYSGHNITSLFNTYKSTMDGLQASYPNVKFIYVTQPLTTDAPADNLTREQYNQMIRQEYGSTGRVFDLAKVESTTPTGTRVSGTYSGQTYYSLYSGYTSDGGHLNTAGSNAAAKELLAIIAAALRQ